jgi:hypothetical protein
MTRLIVFWETRSGVLRQRETVAVETPAVLATSSSLGTADTGLFELLVIALYACLISRFGVPLGRFKGIAEGTEPNSACKQKCKRLHFRRDG